MGDSAPHILIVDDEACVREALTTGLVDSYVVHEAGTGSEADGLLRRYPIAAIILDVVLGNDDGLDLVPQFRVLSDAPILIITGHSTEDLAIRALRANVDDFIKKPLDLWGVRRALRQRISRANVFPDPVARAWRLLAEHPERPHTTGSLAGAVSLCERHLRRRFKATYEKTPRRYLTELRLERAAALLRTTELGIEQIAAQVGMASLTVFGRLFRRAFGVTPSDYRMGRERSAAKQDPPSEAAG